MDGFNSTMVRLKGVAPEDIGRNYSGFNSTMVRLKGHVKCTAKSLNTQEKVQKNGSRIRRPPVVRKTLEVAEF